MLPSKNTTNIMDLFQNKEIVKICAPMVRYSKLPFRNLVRLYDCDLFFTPMIMADSFCNSIKARNNEFTTNSVDEPLIVQFAANKVDDFVEAAKLVSPYSRGIDLNCGCPQRWARQQGLGCVLLEDPQIIFDITRQCRNQVEKPYSISVKMRILPDLRKTVQVCQQLEKAGASFLTIHARTASQITGDINKEFLKVISETLDIPIVANGGVKNLEGCLRLQEQTGCKGVMVANGILQNPTLFTGTTATSLDCIQNWLNICYNMTLDQQKHFKLSQKSEEFPKIIPERPQNLTFQCFHHHLVFMLEKLLPKRKRRVFNSFTKFQDVLNFLKDNFSIEPQLYNREEFDKISPLDILYNDQTSNILEDNLGCDKNFINSGVLNNHGQYFVSKVKNDLIEIDDFSDIFLECD